MDLKDEFQALISKSVLSNDSQFQLEIGTLNLE